MHSSNTENDKEPRKKQYKRNKRKPKSSKNEALDPNTFVYQWPETPTILSSESCWPSLFPKHEYGCKNINAVDMKSMESEKEIQVPSRIMASEKLDGSNLCVGSNGIITSRRKVILRNPTLDELCRTKFSGVPLGEYMATCLQNVSNLSQHLREEIEKSINIGENGTIHHGSSISEDEIEVYIYGEWIHRNCQTSDSKEDKYKYKNRGLSPGHLYVFGVAVVLYTNETRNLIESAKLDIILEKFGNINAINQNSRSYVIRKSLDIRGDPFLIILLNQSLKHLLERFGFEVVPILSESYNLKEGILKFGPQLLPPNIKYEGIIFTGSDIQKAIKLKNPDAEGNDPTNLERYQKLQSYLEKSCDSLDAHAQHENKMLMGIMKNFIDYHGDSSKEKSKVNSSVHFEQAYYSAKSKFPFLSDNSKMKLEMQDDEKDMCFKELIDKYKRTLKEEIIQDLRGMLQDGNNMTGKSFDDACLDQLITDKVMNDLKLENDINS